MPTSPTIERSPFRHFDSRTRGDKVIWAVVLLLVLFSLLTVYSSTGLLAYKMYKGNTEIYLFKQFAFILVGLLIIYFAHQVNYIIYARVAKIVFFLSIPLLLYTLFFGVKLNEGSRWIRLPIINLTFQTSDLAKLALIMFISRLLSRKQEVIKDFKKGFLPVVAPVVLVCLLIAPANLSTALLIGATCMMLMFIGRVSTKHIALMIGVALIPVTFLVLAAVVRHKDGTAAVARTKTEHRSRLFVRLDTWINRVDQFMYGGEKTATDDDNYQINQAKIAVANGRWIGLGPGNSRQRNFLPHPYSDFIFAIIIEEYGLAGGAVIMFIYLVFLYRSIQIFRKCPFAFGAFLSLGLSFTLMIQAIANMAVNVNLFPVTGVTLPLISMGGSSFLFTCLAIGIILSVARNAERIEGEAKLALARSAEEKEEEQEEQPD